ncbi:MAG TPA: hypothetical protein VJH70_02280 [Candidatus Paceibacterota bacterium]
MSIHDLYPVTYLVAETKMKYALPEEKAYGIVETAVKDLAKDIILQRSKVTGYSASYIQKIQTAQKRGDTNEMIKALNELCEAEQPEQAVLDRKIHSMIAQLAR